MTNCIKCGNRLGCEIGPPEDSGVIRWFCENCGIEWLPENHIEPIEWIIQQINAIKKEIGI